jgi:DNA-binding response OmpR family regulator
MNVLIVEDSRFLRMSNERALQQAGFVVMSAADGEEGCGWPSSTSPIWSCLT